MHCQIRCSYMHCLAVLYSCTVMPNQVSRVQVPRTTAAVHSVALERCRPRSSPTLDSTQLELGCSSQLWGKRNVPEGSTEIICEAIIVLRRQILYWRGSVLFGTATLPERQNRNSSQCNSWLNQKLCNTWMLLSRCSEDEASSDKYFLRPAIQNRRKSPQS